MTSQHWQIRVLWTQLDDAGQLAASYVESSDPEIAERGTTMWRAWLGARPWAQAILRRAGEQATAETRRARAERDALLARRRAAIAAEYPQLAGRGLSRARYGQLLEELRARGFDV